MHGYGVLMSVYAKEKPQFFDLSLKSVLLDQTLPPEEMVLVCDGPLTPELDAVIEKYRSLCPALRVHRLPENVGLGEALRIGLGKCASEWIGRADSDDVCAPDRYEKQMAYLQAHPEIDVLGTAIDEFEDDWHNPTRKKILPSGHDELCRLAKLRSPINHVTVMFRRKAIMDCGSYMPMAYTEDYYLWLRAIVHGARLANLDECLVHVRVGNGMNARRGNRAYIHSWKLLNDYMLKNRMVNCIEYARNMLAIIGFVYIPPSLRQWVYNHLLRR